MTYFSFSPYIKADNFNKTGNFRYDGTILFTNEDKLNLTQALQTNCEIETSIVVVIEKKAV